MSTALRVPRAVAAVMAATALLSADVAAVNAVPVPAPLRLAALTTPKTLYREPGAGVQLHLGAYVVADVDWQLRLSRTGYTEPVLARQAIGGGPARDLPLPSGMAIDITGLPAFTRVQVTDAGGALRVDRHEAFCPNAGAVAVRRDTRLASPYPRDCPRNPFALGAVFGMPAGWGAPSTDLASSGAVDLPDGDYTALVTVDQPYRDLLGISDAAASVRTAFTVRTLAARPAAQEHGHHGPVTLPQPAAGRPAGEPRIPRRDPKPDLRALPPWGLRLEQGEGRAELKFSATVWNAGTSPLIVDGYRRTGNQLMDAYQRFEDVAGNPIGYAPAGTFEWDPRSGHEHWHFTDFAQYRLLDATASVVRRSHKEAFCLANTDAVDYTIAGAKWRPGNTDLQQTCGDAGTTSLRQRQDVGSGDTYVQELPGQSFDIADLPNGTYTIEVLANPNGRLHELDTTNNAAYRTVIIAGTPGARTVHVPPHQGIDG